MQQPFCGLEGLEGSTVLGGRYRILSKLGSGGMGTVYLAEDMRLPGKRWAIKESRTAGQEVHAVRAEADMLIRLHHPNLPEIVDYYPPNGRGFSYLIMDYIEGETLLQRFERQGRRMPESQLVSYMLQLCDLFHYLHHFKPEPIVYRDLKPSNLMIDLQERIRLIDFGIARSFKAGQAMDTVPIGTVGFAAPEQFEGRQTDTRTDLYALGALMYYVLSGGQVHHVARRPLGELDASLSKSLTALVEKLLAADPAARCQSAAEVRAELARVSRAQHGAASGGARGAALGAAASAAPKPRVLAVGALYAGAGATFAAIAIARALHALRVQHAVLEPPAAQPELYALLFGEKHAPAGYRCYNDAAGTAPWGSAPWLDGSTLWLPSAPVAGGAAAWGAGRAALTIAEAAAMPYGLSAARSELSGAAGEAARRSAFRGMASDVDASAEANDRLHLKHWLQSLDREIIIADIGADWQTDAVRELLAEADDVVYVVEPLLHKLDSAAARRQLLQLEQLRQSGKRVHGIANKAIAVRQTGDWLQVLPDTPACLLPAIHFTLVAEASWQGVMVQANPEVEPQLVRALTPWLQNWLGSAKKRGKPALNMPVQGGGPARMLRKLWKNG